MKKIKIFSTFILAFLLVITTFQIKVKAIHNSYDYYYDSIEVTVDVYDNRTFKVTESLDVYYNSTMHGIIRDIPTESTVEGYLVKNIKVTGAESKITEYSKKTEIRIGSADKTVSGLQHYEITYDLVHYKDFDAAADYIYMNLLGTDYDTYVDNFKGTIILHDDLKVNSQTITSGKNSSTTNDFVKDEVIDNIYTYTALDVRPYNGITVMLELDEGAFINAPEYQFETIIHSEKWEMTYDENKDVHVTASYTLTSNVSYEDPILISSQLSDYSEVDIQDFKVLQGEAELDKENYIHITLQPGKTETYQFSYTIHYKSAENETALYLLPIHAYDDTKVEYFECKISFPDEIMYTTYCGRNTESVGKLSSEYQNNTLTVKTLSPIYTGEKLSITVYYDNDMFYRPYPKWGTASAWISFLVALALFIADKFKFERGYKNDVPAGLNSLEIGYIYEGKFTSNAIGSILLYWASKGYITIQQESEKSFSIHKQKNPDKYMQRYEQNLFTAMFNLGQNGKTVVSSSKLETSFGPAMEVARDAVEAKYTTGKYSLEEQNQSSIHLQSCLLAFAVFALLIAAPLFFNGVSVVSYLLCALIIGGGFVLSIYCYNANPESKVSFAALIVFVSAIGMGILAMFIYDDSSAAQIFYALIFTAFVGRYYFKYMLPSPLGRQLKSDIRKFRKFLKHYRETNNEDEMFEYDMLPYAVALGLEKAWIRKFKTMKENAPGWYRDNHNTTEYQREWCYYCHRFHYSIGRCSTRYSSYTYTGSSGGSYSSGGSSSSSSSSSYSGGGSSYSGGGSSGGGSGGGGSRGW